MLCNVVVYALKAAVQCFIQHSCIKLLPWYVLKASCWQHTDEISCETLNAEITYSCGPNVTYR